MKELGLISLGQVGPPRDKHQFNICYNICQKHNLGTYDLVMWAEKEHPEWIPYADNWEMLIKIYVSGGRLYEMLYNLWEQSLETRKADSLFAVEY